MKPSEKSVKILWAKRALTATAVLLWLTLIVSIFRSGGGMADQAPKCIFATMVVFGLLTAAYKGLEHLERRERDPK
jgi:hypothetical protein